MCTYCLPTKEHSNKPRCTYGTKRENKKNAQKEVSSRFLKTRLNFNFYTKITRFFSFFDFSENIFFIFRFFIANLDESQEFLMAGKYLTVTFLAVTFLSVTHLAVTRCRLHNGSWLWRVLHHGHTSTMHACTIKYTNISFISVLTFLRILFSS
jgi:hypothetical protein